MDHTGPSPSGISIGAEAGIGAGISVILIVLIVCVALFIRRKPRSSSAAELQAKPDVVEKDGEARAELTASKLYPPYELGGLSPGSQVRAELVASGLYLAHDMRAGQYNRGVKLAGDDAME
jgi:hypothetical protein